MLTTLTERAAQTVAGRAQRVFSGTVKWQAGRGTVEGVLEILIDRQTKLPTRTSFVGHCAAAACSFTQSASYDAKLAVNVPSPILRPNAVQLYGARTDRKLVWRQHDNALTETGKLGDAVLNSVDLAGRFRTVIAAVGSPVVYAMEPNGDLFWLRHVGFRDGSSAWKGPEKIGNGWTSFDKIIAGEDGVIYGRLPDGALRWHRHLGHADGSNSWAHPQLVGQGWGVFKDIVAGSNGVVYGIRRNGDLIWHRHVDHRDGGKTWADPPQNVGAGWQNFKSVFSPGGGIVYSVKTNGNLVWHRHHDHAVGDKNWSKPVTVGSGWSNLKHVFAVRED
jgi:hypothetical protein